MTIEFVLNGSTTRTERPADYPLVEQLRDDHGLFGTKVGCGVGQCGACAVLIDGAAFKSCLIPIGKVTGREVTTIEGLAGGEAFDRVAAALVNHGAVQCGFCTPGFVVAATALLESSPSPSKKEIEVGLAGHLCRCTGYRKIVEAIEAAGSNDLPVEAINTPDAYVGGRITKVDALAKVRGEARYGADIAMPDMLHAVFVRSPLAHARVVNVNTDAASAEPEVSAVLTAADVPGERMIGEILKDTPVLAIDVVRFIGDPVAIVAATTPDAAHRAAQLVDVEYEELPGVFDPESALADRAPYVHPRGNLMGSAHLKKATLEHGAEIAATVEGQYTTPHIEHAYLEPEAGVAYMDDGVLTVLASCQYPHYIHDELVRVTGLSADRTRVIQAPIGGAFGGKVDVTIHMAIALVALKTGQPTKMSLERTESFLTTVKRHPFQIDHSLSADADGRILNANIDIIDDTGAYALAGPIVLKRVATHAAGAYDIPDVDTRVRAAYTNNVPSGAMRGFGLPQAIFATECQVDRLAEALGMDSIELRLKNILRDGSHTQTGQEVFHVGLEECLTTIRSMRDTRRQQLQDETLDVGKRRGLGVAVMHYGLGYSGIPNPAIATITLDGDGRLVVRIGLVDVGQGSSTVFVQIAAETMGVDMSRIDLITNDTWETIDPGPTSASRDTYFGGNAVRFGVDEVKGIFLRLVSDALAIDLDSLEIRRDAIWQDDTRLMSFGEACDSHLAPNSIDAKGVFDPEISLDDDYQGDPYPAYSYAAQLAEVEVDIATGKVDLIKLWAAHDSGQIVNLDGAEGQVEGGAVMALGNTLLEKVVIEDGQILNPDLAGYMIPSIMDTFEIETVFIENAEPSGPFGAKGIGECSLLPTAPAIANAVHDATGQRIFDLPIDPELLLASLEAAPNRVPS